jgi:hypothetical protein
MFYYRSVPLCTLLYSLLLILGPQMALAYRLYVISQGPKILHFQGPIPSQLPT